MPTKVAIVTGAGTGIGAAICRSLAGVGYSLVLLGRRMEPLTALAESLSTESVASTCDVRNDGDIRTAVAIAVERFGRIDVLVNNAGIFQRTPIGETPVELWDDIVSTNLRSAFVLSQVAWPHLIASKGQIINISSISGTMGFLGGAAYCASKYGMNGLNAVLALEGKPHGIRSFALCPAQVATAIWEERAQPEQLERMMTAEQIAEMVRWVVESPRNLDIAPIVVTNFTNPWDA